MGSLDRREFLASIAVSTVALRAPALDPRAWRRTRAGDPRLDRLRATFRGRIVGRGSPAYERLRVLFNRRFDEVYPLAVVIPADGSDVQRVVEWARAEAVQLVARSGGHSYGGYSSIQAGVVVDLSGLAGVSVDPTRRLATVGGGARLVDIYARLARSGLFLPAGSCASVGIAGQALGGGIGFAARRFGTTADNLAGTTIVSADASRLACSPQTHSDLFWACRGGGGGNFGIVTALRFRVHPAPACSFFVVSWPWQSAAEGIDAWQRFAPHAPDELFSICALETGGPHVQAFGQFLGPSSALRGLVASLARVHGATLRVGSLPFLDMQLRWAGCLGKTVAQCHLTGQTPQGTLHRSAFAAKSDYVNKPFSERALATIVAWLEEAEKARFGSAALLLDSYGGALNRVPATATAFVHRNSLFSGQYLSYWRSPAGRPLALQWLRGFHDAMRPHVSGFAYQNYIDPELANWKRAYYGANLNRLIKIKQRVDPDRFFSFAQAIPAG
jgi:hypothetical protein